MSMDSQDEKTFKRIQKLAFNTLAAIRAGKNPGLDIPLRALSNVAFNEKKRIIELGEKTTSREFFNTNMAKKFMQTFLIANGCKTLMEQQKTISIRQMFYMSKHTLSASSENTFDEQSESDPIIEDLEVASGSLREELHLFANIRGRMVGELVVNDAGDQIDLTRMGRGGWGIPSICEAKDLSFVRHRAEFVLVVEKQAVWHRLNEDGFWKKHKCILMTTEGQAARGARRMLQRFATELKLPIYVLVDNDPWGLYIYSVLKQGSINLAYESMRMAVPNVRYLGMSAFDYAKYWADRRREDQASGRGHHARQADQKVPVVRGRWKWQREVDKLLDNGFKMELDGFLTKSISYMTDEYIPKKLRDKDYLV